MASLRALERFSGSTRACPARASRPARSVRFASPARPISPRARGHRAPRRSWARAGAPGDAAIRGVRKNAGRAHSGHVACIRGLRFFSSPLGSWCDMAGRPATARVAAPSDRLAGGAGSSRRPRPRSTSVRPRKPPAPLLPRPVHPSRPPRTELADLLRTLTPAERAERRAATFASEEVLQAKGTWVTVLQREPEDVEPEDAEGVGQAGTALYRRGRELALRLAEAVLSVKAHRVRVLDAALTSPTSRFLVFATVESKPQMVAALGRLVDACAQRGVESSGGSPEDVGPEGPDTWEVVDAGEVEVHVMTEAARKYYAVEELHEEAVEIFSDPGGQGEGAAETPRARGGEGDGPAGGAEGVDVTEDDVSLVRRIVESWRGGDDVARRPQEAEET